MKKLGKMAAVLAMAVAMCFTLVGCGLSIDDIKGDWTVDTINGQSLADYAASIGVTEGQVVTNITIKDDKTMTSTNSIASEEFDIELKGDGFEVKQKGQSDVFMSVKYDKDAQTLSYTIKDATSGTELNYVLKKGSATIEPLTAAPAADASDDAAATDETEDEATDEATDETEDEASEDEAAGDEEVVDESADEEAE